MQRRTIFRRRGLATAFAFLLGVLGWAPADAQPLDLDIPVESPMWWTLTDEISPAELRKEFRDPDAHLARYREAVEVGAPTQPLTDEALTYLSFYYNRRVTPELTPMWLAFDAFAGGHLELIGDAHATDHLTAFGFGPTAIDTILLFATRLTRETQEIVEEVGPRSIRFVEIQRRAIRTRGGDRKAYAAVTRAARAGDLDLLLPHAGVPRAELAELRAAWKRSPLTETAEKLLPELRQRLTEEDWERLRRFLLEHVVARMGNESKDFDPGKGVTP